MPPHIQGSCQQEADCRRPILKGFGGWEGWGVAVPPQRRKHAGTSVWHAVYIFGNFLRRRELLTTLTELNAIAIAPIIGLRRPSAASGMPTML